VDFKTALPSKVKTYPVAAFLCRSARAVALGPFPRR
jgi:hypothetical protein